MYNYQNAHVFLVTTTPAASFEAGAVNDADCRYLGVIESDAGYKLSKSETIKDSNGIDRTLSYKMELTAGLLEQLTTAQKDEIDGKTGSLVFLPPDGVTVPDNAAILSDNLNSTGFVLPASPAGVMTAPVVLSIEEDVKYGTGKVVPTVVTGEKIANSKALLVKDVTINDTV